MLSELIVAPSFWTALGAVLVACLSGWFAWSASRHKDEVEASVVIVSGFTSLLTEFKSERALLSNRILELEKKETLLKLRVMVLEALITSHGLSIPPPQ